jgi:hypothetical protein
MKSPENNKTFAIVSFLAAVALLSAAVLLAVNRFVSAGIHSYLSSFPLGLAGAGYALLQVRTTLLRGILVRRLVLAGAFIGWAADQLLPPGPLAVFLGDGVIFCFILDVFWLIRDQIRSEDRPGDALVPVSDAELNGRIGVGRL